MARIFDRRRPLGRLLRRPAGAFGVAIVGGVVLVAVFAPLLAPYPLAKQNTIRRLEGPSSSHLLGTDEFGRDLLSRIIFGTRIELGVALPAVFVSLIVGLLLGVAAGYLGGRVDRAITVVLDSIQAFPAVILALALLALLGPSLRNLIAVIAVAFAPQYGRVARASVLKIKKEPFMEAERSLGAGHLRIGLVHVLPNIIAPLLILLTMNIPGAIAIEAGLSFLGLGVQPPAASWGVILADGFERVLDTPWAVLATGVTLAITTLGLTMLGETLRDILDPRLSGGRKAAVV
jgi:peptide/nickel transport system permease protein